MPPPAPIGPTALFLGVDIVPRGRLRPGEVEHAVLTDGERRVALAGPSRPWPSICFATKEATVKVCGGRPPHTSLRGIDVVPTSAPDPVVCGLVARVGEVGRPAEASGYVRVRLDARWGGWLAARLCGQGIPAVNWSVDGWWSAGRDDVLAIVVARPVPASDPLGRIRPSPS